MVIAYIIGILLLISIGICIFMQSPTFGKNPTGERLERIRKSLQYKDGSFQNLSFTPSLKEGVSFFKILNDFLFTKKIRNKPTQAIPIIKEDYKNLTNGEMVWFGHSSYLFKTSGLVFLVDPVFSGYAAPVPFLTNNFKGTDKFNVDDFPEIDVLLITHDHYDHLDYHTITKLKNRVKKIITSLGVGSHLEHWGISISKIIELDWKESHQISELVKITATPSRHFSGRGTKRNQTLWSSFVLESGDKKIFIGGDSGYDSHFKAIGNQFGPFDLVILECGQYNDYWHYIHTLPEEIPMVYKDLKAKAMIPIHWGKFALAMHPWDEPILSIKTLAKENEMVILTPQIGKVFAYLETNTFIPWWESVS